MVHKVLGNKTRVITPKIALKFHTCIIKIEEIVYSGQSTPGINYNTSYLSVSIFARADPNHLNFSLGEY